MSKMMKRFGGMAKVGKKSAKKKGKGRVTTPSLPSMKDLKDLRELGKAGPSGLDELLGVRRDKPWP
jgi:hypothetical protein